MRLDTAPPATPQDHGPFGWNVTMANMETVLIFGNQLELEGGALIIRNAKGELVVAFGPGAWLEVQRP